MIINEQFWYTCTMQCLGILILNNICCLYEFKFYLVSVFIFNESGNFSFLYRDKQLYGI